MSSIDDYPSDSTTNGMLQVGATTNGNFEWCNVDGSDYWNDIDWFRLDVQAGFTYDIRGTGTIDMALGWIGEGIRELLLDGFLDGEARIVYTATEDTQVFVSATNILGESSAPYQIHVEQYEIPESTQTLFNLVEGISRSHMIESPFDRDYFRVQWKKDWVYEIDLKGFDSGNGTLLDPLIRIYDDERNLLAVQNDGGINRDSKLRFQAPEEGTFYLSAAGLGNLLGSYAVGYSLVSYVDDAATGTGTTSELSIKENQFRSLNGELEIGSDIDWHRVELVKGRWYQFLIGSSAYWFAIRDPSLQVAGSTTQSHFYFQAQQTGSHYFVVRNRFTPGSPRHYRLTVWDGVPPKIDISTLFVDLLEGQSVNLSELVSLNEFPADRVQLYSEIPYYLDGVHQEAFQLTTIPIDQISRYTFQSNSDRVKVGDVNVRAISSDNMISGWVQTTIQSTPDSKQLLQTDYLWTSENTQTGLDDTITYRFADTLPGYFSVDRFENFAGISEEIRNIFTGLFRYQFNDPVPNIANTTGLKFEYSDSEDADIQIFAADIDTAAVGYRPGRWGGGDIVLDRATYEGDAPEPGTENYLQLIRAIGTAMGLKHWVPQLDRQLSVMGTFNPNDTRPWLSTFGYWDVEQLRQLYGTRENGVSHFGRRFRLGRSAEPFFKTIVRTTDGNLIDAEPANQPVVIDLREGAESYLLDRSQRFVIGRGQFIQRSLGSNHDDRLTGNYLSNRIEGNNGRDVIAGLGGNDDLLGGWGNDRYLYDTGDGEDTISEFGPDRLTGGIDTLQIRGKFGMTGLEDDLTFRRDGNDLLIDLDMNGHYNRQTGQIRIRDMNAVGSQVERLDLRNYTQELGLVSLVSIWNGISSDKQRFKLDGLNDDFGLTAIPV